MKQYFLSLPLFWISALSCLTAEDSHTKYGLARLQGHELEHLESKVLPSIEPELEDLGMDLLGAAMKMTAEKLQASADLPRKVDNSKLPSFPPIGDQGTLGSCVGWASTYYQATHEIGLLHGWNNKVSFEHVLSPKWTYNLINGGTNVGSSPVAAYQLLATSGAPSILDFPYDNNYTAWDLNTDHWISALSYRLGTCTLIPGLGGSGPQNLTAIKQALSSGHVLTFASFVDSWVFTQIKPDPERISFSHEGEYAAFWMNGTHGGHFMTIVGYDDDLWIDINQNGTVDPGERGAFLIANSWGTKWGNQGFIWIAYDAFLENSAVSGGPGPHRAPAGAYFNSSLLSATAKAPFYTPKLIAEFSISQTHRGQINIQAGASSLESTCPSLLLKVPAFANQGGNFEFDGATSCVPETATFAIDLTDLASFLGPQRYYLLVSDNVGGDPTVLHSFSLLDLVRHQKKDTHFPLPQSYDNNSGTLFIDY